MIDLQSAVAVFPNLWQGLRGSRSQRSIIALPRGLAAAHARSTTAVVPWTWSDATRAMLWASGLAAGGLVGLVVLRVLVAIVFTTGAFLHLMRPGKLDQLTAVLHPYLLAGSSLVFGGIIAIALLYGVYHESIRRYRLAWSHLYFHHAGWRIYGRSAALSLPVMLGGLLVTRIETLVLGNAAQSQQVAGLTNGVPPLMLNFVLLFLLLAVIAPITEEILFRGFLYRLLRNRLPVWAAIPITAAASALAHGEPALLPWLFFMGLVFAVLVERTKSVYCSIILHCLINAVGTLGIILTLVVNAN